MNEFGVTCRVPMPDNEMEAAAVLVSLRPILEKLVTDLPPGSDVKWGSVRRRHRVSETSAAAADAVPDGVDAEVSRC